MKKIGLGVALISSGLVLGGCLNERETVTGVAYEFGEERPIQDMPDDLMTAFLNEENLKAAVCQHPDLTGDLLALRGAIDAGYWSEAERLIAKIRARRHCPSSAAVSQTVDSSSQAATSGDPASSSTFPVTKVIINGAESTNAMSSSTAVISGNLASPSTDPVTKVTINDAEATGALSSSTAAISGDPASPSTTPVTKVTINGVEATRQIPDLQNGATTTAVTSGDSAASPTTLVMKVTVHDSAVASGSIGIPEQTPEVSHVVGTNVTTLPAAVLTTASGRVITTTSGSPILIDRRGPHRK
jgi:hypothetical protein